MPIWEMIQVLEAGSGSKSASFNSIFRSRHVTPPSFAKWMSGRINGIWPRKTSFPYGDRDESRFSLDFEIPLSIPGMKVAGDPNFPREVSCVQVLNERKQRFEGPEKAVLAGLMRGPSQNQ